MTSREIILIGPAKILSSPHFISRAPASNH